MKFGIGAQIGAPAMGRPHAIPLMTRRRALTAAMVLKTPIGSLPPQKEKSDGKRSAHSPRRLQLRPRQDFHPAARRCRITPWLAASGHTLPPWFGAVAFHSAFWRCALQGILDTSPDPRYWRTPPERGGKPRRPAYLVGVIHLDGSWRSTHKKAPKATLKRQLKLIRDTL